jgi:hypothetical protein
MSRDTRFVPVFAVLALAVMLTASTVFAAPAPPTPDSTPAEAPAEAPTATEPAPLAEGSLHGLVIVRGQGDDTTKSLDEQRRLIVEQMREALAERLASSPFAPPANTPEKVMLDNGMERLRLGVGGLSMAVVRMAPDGSPTHACVQGAETAEKHLDVAITETATTEWVKE